MSRIIVIAGPTASGKTSLSLELALRAGGEIVSADSMQIYRGMDIGTAKATTAERALIPHHMIDVVSPEENYSVARYVEDAARCCEDILSRGKIPVIVGGTGLYIDSLLSGRSFAENSDSGLREELEAQYDTLGGEAMLERLSKVDPERAALLSPNDRRRIVRSIEIFELTGLTISEHDAMTRLIPPRYEARRIVLGYRDRQELYSRINTRVDMMMSAGLKDEVSLLLSSGISSDSTAMQAIGYKELGLCLKGELSEEDAVELIKLRSRRYAKRQITWFSHWEDAHPILWDGGSDIPGALDYLNREGVL